MSSDSESEVPPKNALGGMSASNLNQDVLPLPTAHLATCLAADDVEKIIAALEHVSCADASESHEILEGIVAPIDAGKLSPDEDHNLKKKIADEARALVKEFTSATKDIAQIASIFVRSDNQYVGAVSVLRKHTNLLHEKYGNSNQLSGDGDFFASPANPTTLNLGGELFEVTPDLHLPISRSHNLQFLSNKKSGCAIDKDSDGNIFLDVHHNIFSLVLAKLAQKYSSKHSPKARASKKAKRNNNKEPPVKELIIDSDSLCFQAHYLGNIYEKAFSVDTEPNVHDHELLFASKILTDEIYDELLNKLPPLNDPGTHFIEVFGSDFPVTTTPDEFLKCTLGKKETITIIQDVEDNIYIGYNASPWPGLADSDLYIESAENFIILSLPQKSETSDVDPIYISHAYDCHQHDRAIAYSKVTDNGETSCTLTSNFGKALAVAFFEGGDVVVMNALENNREYAIPDRTNVDTSFHLTSVPRPISRLEVWALQYADKSNSEVMKEFNYRRDELTEFRIDVQNLFATHTVPSLSAMYDKCESLHQNRPKSKLKSMSLITSRIDSIAEAQKTQNHMVKCVADQSLRDAYLAHHFSNSPGESLIEIIVDKENKYLTRFDTLMAYPYSNIAAAITNSNTAGSSTNMNYTPPLCSALASSMILRFREYQPGKMSSILSASLDQMEDLFDPTTINNWDHEHIFHKLTSLGYPSNQFTDLYSDANLIRSFLSLNSTQARLATLDLSSMKIAPIIFEEILEQMRAVRMYHNSLVGRPEWNISNNHVLCRVCRDLGIHPNMF